MTKDVLVSVRGIHTAEADGENGNVEVIKNGLAKTHMVFEEHKTNVSYYATSFGKMMVGVSTNTKVKT